MKIIFGILVLLVLCLGCQSSHQTLSDKTIRLRAPKSSDIRLYQVLRTNALAADQEIRVKVSGWVLQPGVVTLPKGSSLLEAIIAAGGFEKAAVFWSLAVVQGGQRYKLELHRANDLKTLRCLAWYGGHDDVTDFLLEDGAEVEVRFWPPAVRGW